MTPHNTTQNLLLWAIALVVSVIVAFLTSLNQQLGGTDDINWRPILSDVIKTLLVAIPVVAAGFGLPRIGHEEQAALVSELGKDRATEALQYAARGEIQPNTSVVEILGRSIDAEILAEEMIKVLERKSVEAEKQSQQVSNTIREGISKTQV